MPTPSARSQILADNLARFETARKRSNRRSRSLLEDRTLQTLVTDLVPARVAAGMTQEDVAARMSTIEQYARAVGAVVEIRVEPQR